MSHRYHEKIKMTGEGKESVASPYSLDSLFSKAHVSPRSKYGNCLEGITRERLQHLFNDLDAGATAYIVGGAVIRDTLEILEKEFGFKDTEGIKLIDTFLQMEADELNELASEGLDPNITVVFPYPMEETADE